MNLLDLGGRILGIGKTCFVIAEAGVNHNGDLTLARDLVSAAAEAGADAVKFQTFRAEKLATRGAPKARYQLASTKRSQSQLEMLRELELSTDDHRELMDVCEKRGILFLSSPFEEDSCDLLHDLGVCAFKLPSGELTNTPFLAHVAAKQKPIFLSTGMADLEEVRAAVTTITQEGNTQLVLLHCVSNYPTAPQDVNLRAMATMSTAFGFPVGYSDHSVGNEIALAAVALGACVLEKHFTISRTLPGPDHQASLEPMELKTLVTGIRAVESALGSGVKLPAQSEADTRIAARKSLVAARDLAEGTVLDGSMVIAKRPGTGISPASKPALVGRTLRSAVAEGTILTFDLFTP